MGCDRTTEQAGSLRGLARWGRGRGRAVRAPTVFIAAGQVLRPGLLGPASLVRGPTGCRRAAVSGAFSPRARRAAGIWLALLAACAAPRTPEPEPASWVVAPGETFEIRLPTTAGTGFTWEVTGEIDAQVIELVSKTIDDSALVAERVGAPATAVLTFRGVAPGTTRLTLGYLRPWETGVGPARVADYAVRVRAP